MEKTSVMEAFLTIWPILAAVIIAANWLILIFDKDEF